MNSIIILIISLIAGAIIGYLLPKKSSESKIYEHDIEGLKQRIQDISNLLDTEKEAKAQAQGDFNKCKEDLFEKTTKYDSLNTQFNDIATQKRLADQEKVNLLDQKQALSNE
jgi:chromosome segregation ATPase